MKVLITGHDGFIGRNMFAWMINEGWSVDGWKWDPKKFPDVKQYDWIVHLGAAYKADIDTILTKNLEFSQRLFNECQENEVHLQYASSSDVYGNGPNFAETAPGNPLTPYAWSKYLFDRWVFQQENRMFVQGFRYFNVYGKWMHLKNNDANLIHKWREQARHEGQITVCSNAENVKWDWTWVGDVCKLHIDFIKEVNGSGIWNVGSGLSHSLLDIAEEVAEKEGVPLNFSSIPAEGKNRKADLTHLKSTIGKRKWLNVFEYLDQ
jgi:ADP-L-glycero-D-manno-heptose 6-epimerase